MKGFIEVSQGADKHMIAVHAIAHFSVYNNETYILLLTQRLHNGQGKPYSLVVDEDYATIKRLLEEAQQ
jgi:hypothetical protein